MCHVFFATSSLSLLLLGAHRADALGTQGSAPLAGHGDYTVRAWQHEHGLPDNSVPALRQTSDGYLWIGTRVGLARFDGVRFVVFNRANTPAMVSEVCQAIAEDRAGSLWVGTEDGLLCRRAGDWTRYAVPDGLPATNVWALCVTRDGSIWIGTGLGLARFQKDRLVTLAGPTAPGRCAVMAFHEDPDGRLWVATSLGLFRWNPPTDTFDQDMPLPVHYEIYEDPASPAAYTPRPPANPVHGVSGVFRDPAGRLWLASYFAPAFQHLLHCWDGTAWTQVIPDYVAGAWPANLAAEADGRVWIPTLSRGLWQEDRGRIQAYPLPGVGPNRYPQAFTMDRQGNIWIGTSKAGLYRLCPERLNVLAADDGLAHDLTWSVCEARDGSVWIGTDGGVSRYQEGRCTNYSQTQGLSRNEVRAVAETRDGTMWVGTLNGLDAIRDGQISHMRFPGEWFETKIRALLPARDGALWVGTVRGLNRLHNGEVTKFTTAEGLGAQEVRALLEDRAGSLWVGTFGGGLSCLREGKFTTLSTTNGLSDNQVWALHEDAEGVLWIGTGRGLNRLQDGQITAFTTREGLPEDLVNTVIEDDLGRLWIGHDRGIYWVSRNELNAVAAGQARSVRAVRYDEADGLLSREVNGQKSFPAACKTRDGRLWIATLKGVAVINPAKVAVDAMPLVSVIEEVRANGETVFDNSRSRASVTSDGRGAAADASDLSLPTTTLRFAPGRGRVLELRYTAGALVAPEKVRFRYRMAGLSPNWIDVGTRREVFFTDLRPGKYAFELAAANPHGVWSERRARMTIEVEPHFYQTWWFWTAVAGCVLGGVATGVRTRLRQQQHWHALERQTALAQERNRIARDIHDDLGAGLTRLVLTGGRVATSLEDAEARTAIQRLTGEAAGLLDQLGDLVWCTNHQFDTLDSLLARLREHAATFLDEVGVEVRFDLPTHVPALPLTGTFRRQTFLLFKEILTNISRHAQAREVHITIRLHPPERARQSTLQLRIADNGRGFDLAAAAQAQGHGLRNLRTRVATLQGSLNLRSSPGAGTTLEIQVPLPASGAANLWIGNPTSQ